MGSLGPFGFFAQAAVLQRFDIRCRSACGSCGMFCNRNSPSFLSPCSHIFAQWVAAFQAFRRGIHRHEAPHSTHLASSWLVPPANSLRCLYNEMPFCRRQLCRPCKRLRWHWRPGSSCSQCHSSPTWTSRCQWLDSFAQVVHSTIAEFAGIVLASAG